MCPFNYLCIGKLYLSVALGLETVYCIENATAVCCGSCCSGRKVIVSVVTAAVEPAVEQQYHKGNDQPRGKGQLVVLVQHRVQQQ